MKRLAVDTASILWTSLRTGKDPAGTQVDHEGSKKWVNTAKYAYEFAINSINGALKAADCVPCDLILVVEGANSKRQRCWIDPNYKATGRDKAEEEYAQYQDLREMVIEAYRNLGAIAVTQEGVEGDDILGWLAANAEFDLMIHTFDNDLMVLHGKNERGHQIDVRINGEVGRNKYGPFDHKLIVLWKALVGDSSDKIKGCPGFGQSAFAEMFGKYGEQGMFEMLDVIATGSFDKLDPLYDQCKLVKKILDSKAEVAKSYKLASLHPEWVNVMDNRLEWRPGMVTSDFNKDTRLACWRQMVRLVTNENLLEAYNFLKSKLPESPYVTFDIETSGCDESDDWLAAQGEPNGVDVLGSTLTGFSLTFGTNRNYTYYVSVDHRDTDNISREDARLLLELALYSGKPNVIQNTSFEGAVLANEVDNGIRWQDRWKDNGYRGFIPNWQDTLFEASYVDENFKLGLKERSKLHLGYEQQNYMQTVCKTGWLHELPSGGRVIAEPKLPDDLTAPEGAEWVTKQYRMNELTAKEVFSYGCDDTIVTAALHNFYQLVMQLEHTWDVYLKVEIDASYQHVQNFLQGRSFSLATMRELEAEDKVVYDAAWEILKDYLVKAEWDGTVLPTFTPEITVKEIKAAYSICLGVTDTSEDDEEDAEVEEGPKDPVLASRVRTPSKFVAVLEQHQVGELFTESVRQCLDGDPSALNQLVAQNFTGQPLFKVSPKQMHKLLYEVMQLPVQVYNKPTAKQRKLGIRQGSAKTDALAVKYGLLYCDEHNLTEVKAVLRALQQLQMVKTRRQLYYDKYPYFLHWKTGKLHSSHRQCSTVTRRASVAKPNDQQEAKHAKVEGEAAPRFRECTVPHHKDAVVVSLDFSQQELRIIADYSRDPNMVACYVGDNKKDMHILTALGIVQRKYPERQWSYEIYAGVMADESHPDFKFAKKYRSTGKTTNFATEYGAMATKLSQTMLITEEEAQVYIDAKAEAFPVVQEWKDSVIEEAQTVGFVRTKLGAIRHLQAAMTSDDRWERSKAERQAVNFKVQSSSAEMTKLAEGRMWKAGLSFIFDAVCYGPIHDEVVWSVAKKDLPAFLKACHACMVAPYADMWIPIESSISFGPNFGTQFEIGEQPTEDAVNDGFAKWQKWSDKRKAA